MRFAVCCLIACTHHTIAPRAPPPKPRPPEPPAQPGERLDRAQLVGDRIEPPLGWIEGRPQYARTFPSPAYSLEERWLNKTVCREAFYDSEPPAHDDSVYRSLVDALAGDDKVRASSLVRDGLRLNLRRERYCIYHECQPPLSPPATVLTICDDMVAPDMDAVARTFVTYVKSLDGHNGALAIAHASIATLRRTARERRVDITLSASAVEQDRLRDFFVEHGYATVDPAITWALNSTSPKRSYLFYPQTASTMVSFTGRMP